MNASSSTDQSKVVNNSASQSETTNELLKEYVESFDEKDKIVYEIAKKNLESSFDLEKSLGFKNFLKKRQNS
jgi:hypothetical protein